MPAGIAPLCELKTLPSRSVDDTGSIQPLCDFIAVLLLAEDVPRATGLVQGRESPEDGLEASERLTARQDGPMPPKRENRLNTFSTGGLRGGFVLLFTGQD